MKHQRQSGITVTGLMLISGSGITLADTKFQMVRLTRIQSKEIMLNSVIIWLVLLADHVAFLVARTRLSALCVFLFIVSMAGNFTNNGSQTIQLT
jgi:uncharacterized membrane protein